MAILNKISVRSALKKQQKILNQINILEKDYKFNNANKLLKRLLKFAKENDKGNIYFRIADNFKSINTSFSTEHNEYLKLALENYLKSLEYSSSHSLIESYQSVAECYKLLGNIELSKKYLEKILLIDPSSYKVFEKLFSINYHDYSKEDRTNFLNELLSRHPNNEYVYYYFGEELYFLDRETAFSNFRHAIDINPKNEMFYIKILDLLYDNRLYLEANKYVQILIEYFPDSYGSVNQVAFFYNIKSEFYSPKTAITFYLKAIEINSNIAFNNYLEISKIYEDLFQYSESIKYLELALPISQLKKSSSIIDQLASHYGIKSSISQKNLAEIHFSLAVLYNVVGQKVLSIQHFIDAIQISKKYMDAPNINLAFDSEIVQSKQILAAEPYNKESLYLLGCRLLEFNNFNSAANYLGLLYHADKNYKDIQQKFDEATTKWIDSVYSEIDISPARFIIGNEENY